MRAARQSPDEVARRILSSYRRFAVVGCSDDPRRPSFGVARFLLARGYEVIPVNPNYEQAVGLRCYPDLRSAAEEHEIEVVDLFRRSRFIGGHVAEAIDVGAKAIWMQLGVVDAAAAQRAVDAGMDVVMDRCPAIDHPRFFG